MPPHVNLLVDTARFLKIHGKTLPTPVSCRITAFVRLKGCVC